MKHLLLRFFAAGQTAALTLRALSQNDRHIRYEEVLVWLRYRTLFAFVRQEMGHSANLHQSRRILWAEIRR